MKLDWWEGCGKGCKKEQGRGWVGYLCVCCDLPVVATRAGQVRLLFGSLDMGGKDMGRTVNRVSAEHAEEDRARLGTTCWRIGCCYSDLVWYRTMSCPGLGLTGAANDVRRILRLFCCVDALKATQRKTT